ncbi:MAG: 30S ribosome-binding factor RbfA [Candidatus Coproplasma sp.]
MKGNRGERLSSQFREEIYSVISTDLRNKYPQMSAIISLTEVDVAPDLKTANAYVSIYDTNAERRKETFDILVKNAGHIRHCLSQVLRLRTVPELRFILDNSMEYGNKIDKILKEIDAENGDGDEK